MRREGAEARWACSRGLVAALAACGPDAAPGRLVLMVLEPHRPDRTRHVRCGSTNAATLAPVPGSLRPGSSDMGPASSCGPRKVPPSLPAGGGMCFKACLHGFGVSPEPVAVPLSRVPGGLLPPLTRDQIHPDHLQDAVGGGFGGEALKTPLTFSGARLGQGKGHPRPHCWDPASYCGLSVCFQRNGVLRGVQDPQGPVLQICGLLFLAWGCSHSSFAQAPKPGRRRVGFSRLPMQCLPPQDSRWGRGRREEVKGQAGPGSSSFWAASRLSTQRW